jgi:hypothetical protein
LFELATVSLVEPLTELTASFALIVDVPGPTAVANPPGFVMVATNGLEDAQVAVVVKSCVVPSVSVPIAVNCCFPPTLMVGFDGVTVTVFITGAVTVSTAVLLVIAPRLAVIFVLPCIKVLATPLELMVATPVCDDNHVTCVVMFAVELSE